jgi:long-chain acyl-CoA synthetase
VIGDRRKFLSCLIVPNFEKLGDWAKANGLGSLKPESLVKESRVLEIYQKAIDEWNEGKSHEQLIVRFALLPNDLSIEGGELTPTLKVKRRIIDQKYSDLIDGMYKGGD